MQSAADIAEIKDAQIIGITDCLRIIRSEGVNNSDDTFLAACRCKPGEKLSSCSSAIANALKGVRFWYLRQCANQKEEFVLRDLLISLLEPIIEKKKGERSKQFKRYLRFILWALICLYRHDAFQLFRSWIEMENGNKLWLLQVFTLLCLVFENAAFIDSLVIKDSAPSSAQQASTLIQVISEDSSNEPTSVIESLPSLDSLCELHPILHSILQSHSTELNQRWLIPCYNAQLYVIRQYMRSSRIVTRSVLEEMEFLFTCYKQLARSTKNDALDTLLLLVQHTHKFYFSIIGSLMDQQSALEVQEKRLERDGQDLDEVHRSITALASRCQSLAKLCAQDYQMMLGELFTRQGATPTQELDTILNGLSSTSHCDNEKDKSAFYSLLRLLIAKLARFSEDQLHQYAKYADQSLLAICMNSTRIFKEASHNPRDQESSLYGDITTMTTSLARVAIHYTETANRVSQFAQELLDYLEKDEGGMSREVTTGLLSVCMEKNPKLILQTLLQRLSQSNAMEVIAVLRLYLENSHPEEDLRHQIGSQLSRFLQWNDQVNNRLLDHLVCCIPFLPVQDVINGILDSPAPSPSQQQSYIDCLVALLKSSTMDHDRAELVWSLLWNRQTENLVSLALKKWNEETTGDEAMIADVIWSFLQTHASDVSAVFSWLPHCYKPLFSFIISAAEALEVKPYSESDLFQLDILCHYESEWLDILFDPIDVPSPVFYSSIEQTQKQTNELFNILSSLSKHLFQLAIGQEDEKSLLIVANAFTRLPWKIEKHVLTFLLLLQHLCINDAMQLFTPSFTLHRTVSYCIQRVLILFGKNVVQDQLLDVIIRHAFEAIRIYTGRSKRIFEKSMVSEEENADDSLSLTQLTHVTTSCAHVAAFCICLEIQDVKPLLEGKVVDLSLHKQDRLLPRLCSIMQEICVYDEMITEKKDKNRFYIASLLQIIVLVLQSVDTSYILYVFKRVYPIVILMLTHEQDELLVSLCLTAVSSFFSLSDCEEDSVSMLMRCCIRRFTHEKDRCDLCIQCIVLILAKHNQSLMFLDNSDVEHLRKALRTALDVYHNDQQKQIATELLIRQLNL